MDADRLTAAEWKFQVRGTFVRSGTAEIITACEAIIESGDREEHSPFCLEWVGPGARAQPDGTFTSLFGTKGAALPIEVPETVSVFVRVGPGSWKPYIVDVDPRLASRLTSSEMLLELGHVQIERDESLYVA